MPAPSDPGDRPRILFVDDDADVLDGIRLSLRRERRRWDVIFASSGEEARDIVDADPAVAVVVTDMRMPGLDGPGLLRHLKATRPSVIRIVLSGEASAEQTMRSMPHVHRWLPKPCDRDELVDTIDSALAYSADRSGRIDDLVGGTVALPSPPAMYVELMAAFEDPDRTFEEVAELVEHDPAITAKVLQWGCSPLFGGIRGDRVADVLRAVGLRAAAQLVLSVEVLDRMTPEREVPGCTSEQLRAHAELTARLASVMVSPSQAGVARTAGLLHQVGLLILASRAHEELVGVMEAVLACECPLLDVERGRIGLTHVEIGARLLALWGLPHEIVEAVQSSPDAVADPSEVFISPAAAVRVASSLAGAVLAPDGGLNPRVAMVCAEPRAADGSVPLWYDRALQAVHRPPNEASSAGPTERARVREALRSAAPVD